MKKIAIMIISLFLLLSAVNFGTSKPILNNESTLDLDGVIDESVIDNVQEQQILQNINRLDGFFTENQGQVGDDSVKYYIQGKGVWFLDDGVVFEIQEPSDQIEVKQDSFDRFQSKFEPEMPNPRKSVVLKLNFEGRNKVKPIGMELLSHQSNFFYGNDSSKWCTNVPNYQEIVYENIYNDIDLRYYSSEKGLKYDFIVHPGGDPSDIVLKYDGTEELKVDEKDNLIIHTSIGNIVDSELFIYQVSANNENKVDGEFKLIDEETYGFEIQNEYNKDKVLIIDPLIFSTFIGGSDDDRGYDITIDNNDFVYITGYTESNNFPNTTGSNDTTFNGQRDCYVLKLNSTGSSIIFSTYVGGTEYDYGLAILIDSSLNVCVGGNTYSPNFPTTPGANDTTHNMDADLFILKLNPTGSAFIFSTFIGGSNNDFFDGLFLDANGDVYGGGTSQSSNFPTTPGVYNESHTPGAAYDLVIFKLNSIGTLLLFSTYVGHSGEDMLSDITCDSYGNIYGTGKTSSLNFPITSNSYDTTFNGYYDVFVFKLNSTGSNLLYSTLLGGSGLDDEGGSRIALDNNFNVYVTGYTHNSEFPNTTGAFDITQNGDRDVFVFKLNLSGNGANDLIYSTFIGGTGYEHGIDIEIDSLSNAYVTGLTDSIDFPITPNAYNSTNLGVFIIKLDPLGSSLIYSTLIGPGVGYSLSLDGNDIYIVGATNSPYFPNTTGAYDNTHNGGFDVFTLKFSLNTLPLALDLHVTKPSIFRSNIVYLFANASDIEDIEMNLTPHFEYRDPNEQVWNKTFFTIPQYQNSRWEVGFTPPKNATLGLYDFKVRFNDTSQVFSNWIYLNDSLTVLNNIPAIIDLTLSNNSALLGDIISIGINATDIEEIEQNLTIELEYRDPSEISWDNTYLGAPTYINGRWESSFNLPFDALFGHYDFRVRCNDSDGNYSKWLYLNDSLLVYNTGPIIIDAGLSEISIYRTESAMLYVNGSDFETPEDMLSFFTQYKPQSESEWTNLTSNYLNNRYEVSLITYSDSILGNYDFRVKFEDNESVSSGWKYINDSLDVLNNLPIISDTLDDISVGIQPLIFDLTPFENDIEDSDTNLTWIISPQTYTYIESIELIDLENDTIEITPKENVSGTEDIELTLTDKDSGTAVKSDITIIIDSTVSEFTPKVTLISPVDKAVINTLTPTLKWELDYTGTEIITYSVALDENPDPKSTIKTGLTTTEYTLENELVDGKTYYWKVEPTNGICLSGAFRFTINLGFEPIYNVNLTAETDSATIKQGASKNINLTVTNEGNSGDNFEIEISTVNLQSHIDIDKNNVQLGPDTDINVKLTIDIPVDFTIGDYTITVTATSLTHSIVKDEVTIDIKVVSKDFVPDYDLSVSISPTSLELEQGDTENVTITISNNGNIEDDFTVSFESNDFTSSNIQFSESSIPLSDGDSDTITVTIKIPENLESGVYTIKFIVEGSGDPKESTLTITLKDKDGEEPEDKKDKEDNTILYALIGIIVVIIVVLILLFIFLKKKKGKDEEPYVEEPQPPPPEEVPPEQLPTSETLPEQVPAPELPPEQIPPPETPPPEPTPTPEAIPPQPQPQVEPRPEPTPIPQVEEQPAPQVEQPPQPVAEQPPEPPQQPPIEEPPAQPKVPKIIQPENQSDP